MAQVIRVVVGAGGSKNNPGWMHTQEEDLDLLKRIVGIENFHPTPLLPF